MGTRGSGGRTALVSLSVMALLLAPGGALRAFMQGRLHLRRPPQPDGGWPRRYVAPDGAEIVIYEPQIASWENQQLMTLLAAVSYMPKGEHHAAARHDHRRSGHARLG